MRPSARVPSDGLSRSVVWVSFAVGTARCFGGCSHNKHTHLMRFSVRFCVSLRPRQRDHSSRTRCSCRRAASSITFTIRRVAGRSAAGIRPDRLHARSAACRCAALPCCCRVAFLCSRALNLCAAPSTSKVSDKIVIRGVFLNVLNRGGRGQMNGEMDWRVMGNGRVSG